MRLAIFSLAAALTAATPALADEARIEAHGGIVFASGDSEGVLGVAAGYDWDLGDSAFIGVEGSADKVLVDGSDVIFGTSARIGAKVGTSGKLYGLAGYSFGEGEDAPHAGVGYEHGFGNNVYGKVEYRHYFIDDFTDLNSAVIGVGVRF